MDNKRIHFSAKARDFIVEGINIVANAVKTTLGYGGRVVVISETGFPARTTKDGVTVASHIKVKSEELDAGAKIMKEVSYKTAQDVGDGTTTVCVLMQEMVNKGVAAIKDGRNAIQIKAGMESAVQDIIIEIEKQKIPYTDELGVAVATVSANNDHAIGSLIGDTYKKIGQHGIISIEDNIKGADTSVELIEGFHFDSGFVSPYFITDHTKNTCELSNPFVLITEHRIQDVSQIWDILKHIAAEDKPIVIISEDFDPNVVKAIVLNSQSNSLKACLIKYNFLGETKQELMYDICAITGTKPAEADGNKLEKLRISDLGRCEKIKVSKDDTVIIRGEINKTMFESRIQDAKAKIDTARNQFEKQKAERRLSKLTGSLAICYVGADTEIELAEKKDRIDDAIRATKAAIEEGVLPGAGSVLYNISRSMVSAGESDFNYGRKLVYQAISLPAKQIYENATAFDLMEYEHLGSLCGNIGYNAATGKAEDLVKAGIVDPVKVVKTCVKNAVSGAAQVLISEALIVSDNQ